jgi:hypothetical protein
MIASLLHRSFIAPNVCTIACQQCRAIGRPSVPAASHCWRKLVLQIGGKVPGRLGLLRRQLALRILAAGSRRSTRPDVVSRAGAQWLSGLGQHTFIGTEPRPKTVFGPLKQIIDRTELNPRARIAELQKRRAGIDAEITKIKENHLELMEQTKYASASCK